MNSSSSASVPNSSGGSEIAQLQKQLNALMKQLRDVTTGNLDAKTKMEKTALLQQEIQMVAAQIAALQREQKQAKEPKDSKTPEISNLAKQGNTGSIIDTYA